MTNFLKELDLEKMMFIGIMTLMILIFSSCNIQSTELTNVRAKFAEQCIENGGSFVHYNCIATTLSACRF